MATSGGLRLVDAGRATTIQDLGRPGLASLGVPRAGAVDRSAHDLANRLVGNEVDAATLETNGGLIVEATRALVVATGPSGVRHTLAPGARLRVDPPRDMLWGYLAVRGGLAVTPVLGSRSHDTLSGLGPDPLISGAELPVGSDPGTVLVADQAPQRVRERLVRLWPGPRVDRFADPLGMLVGRTWTVSSATSRIGSRLQRGDFTPVSTARLASEGLVPGAIQVTPSGEPVVMLANHPTTGGYPVVAVVDEPDLSIVAQAPPGVTVRFRLAS